MDSDHIITGIHGTNILTTIPVAGTSHSRTLGGVGAFGMDSDGQYQLESHIIYFFQRFQKIIRLRFFFFQNPKKEMIFQSCKSCSFKLSVSISGSD